MKYVKKAKKKSVKKLVEYTRVKIREYKATENGERVKATTQLRHKKSKE